MSLLDILSGGKSGEATDAEKAALAAISGVGVPTQQQLSLPELQKYAVSQNMSPAQMQAFLQQNNALNAPVAQTGTAAQQAAINQLASVAGAGGNTPQEQAQVAQIMQDTGRNLAGQRGAIEQQAEARGVPVGMLQAALQSQNAGQDLQTANQGALQAQGQAYQQALQAMGQGAGAGATLQGQQNTQANTVGQAQNAMQQFNAANQQNAAANNAGYQQQANQYNTGMANQIGQQNTGLANERTRYNAQVPETVFQNQMQKAGGVAGANQNIAQNATNQGNQELGIYGGLLGAGATAFGGPGGAMLGSGAGRGFSSGPPASANTGQYAPPGYEKGGVVNPIPAHYDCGHPGCMAHGGMVDYKHGGQVPGHAQVAGDSPQNDTVHANLSPGEVVLPRSMTQSHPEDVAALLAAMKHLRGQNAPR